MKLHLIRHAKTEQFSPTGKDFDRELMERGKKQGVELNQFLSNQDLKGALVFCSSSARTRETLSFLTDNFGPENIFFEKSFYLCSEKTYLDWLWQQNHNKDLVIIGHNFGISDLANYFLDESNEMRTAEYVCISFPFESWKETSRSTGSLYLRYRPSA
jgi:phosphohistidine phosphatase|tara:strand:+ start:7593 stop:8066 length:474 start_codon:yes stop_codon:yes gene_type:complete